MMSCTQIQPLLLDYLYGLVEGPEAAAVEEHLQRCPRCTTALQRAEQWQKLLAEAARARFPHVRFQPPKYLATPCSLSTAPAPSPASTWLAWAVAAAIWIIGPLVLLTIHDHQRQIQSAQQHWQLAHQDCQNVDEQLKRHQQSHQQAVAEAQRRLAAAEQLARGLLERWLATSRPPAALPDSVEVFGPPRLQAGVPNELLLVMRHPAAHTSGRIIAEIRDQSDAVLFSQWLDPQRFGTDHQRLYLPARLWTKVSPQSELFLVLWQQDERTQQRTLIQEKIRLSGPVYVTFLTTDRHRYRPGETIYFRSVTLDRVYLQPPPREQHLHYCLKDNHGRVVSGMVLEGSTALVRTDTSGQVTPVLGPDDQPLRGVGCGALVIPPELPDGEYILEVSEKASSPGTAPFAVLPARCRIRVERGQQEQLTKHLDFQAAAFPPGSWVKAQVRAHLGDRPATRLNVEAHAWADGQMLPVAMVPHGHTANDGTVELSFRLPEAHLLPRGDVRLQVILQTPNGPEKITRAVPVVGKKIHVEFFPEGGHLVAGVPCRVYFRATNPAGAPVDIRGVITDGQRILAHVETLRDPQQPGVNRGLGSFMFTPELGRYFWLQLHEPSGSCMLPTPELWYRQGGAPKAAVLGLAGAVASSRGYLLPQPQQEGVVVTVLNPVFRVGEPLRVRLCSVGKSQRRLVVGAYIRGALAETRAVTVHNLQWEEITLLADTAQTWGGVVRLTVYEDKGEEVSGPDLIPLAERLVFRHGGQLLQLQAEVQSPPFGDGQPALLTLKAKDPQGRPVPAILYAAVVNHADAPTPHHRSLTTHFLVAGEVQNPDDLEYADFLLTSHPQAADALDLLLGTQGWRRFQDVWGRRSSAFTPVAGYDPERFANQDLPLPIPWLGNLTQRVRSEQEQQLRLLEEYWRPYEQAVLQWQQARSELQTIENNPRYRHAETQLQLQALKHQRSLRLAGTQWQTAIRTWQAWQQARAILLGSIVLLLLAGVVAVWRRWIQPLPWGVGTTGLLALLVLGTILFIQTDRFVQAADVPVVPAESEMANGLACSIAPSVGSDNVGAATPMQPTNPSEAPLLQITNPSAVFNPPSHRPALDNPYGRSGDIQASTLNPVTTPNPPVGTGTIAGRVLSPSGQKVDVKENNAPPLASNKAGQSPPSGGVALLVTGDVQRMGAAPAPPLPMGAGHRPPTMFAPAPKMRENEGRPFGPPPPGGGRRYADAPKFMIHPPFELDGQGKILSESQAPRQATAGIGGAPTTIGSQEKQLIQVTEQRTDRLTGQAARSTRTDELLLRKSGTAEQIIADRQKALEYARQLQDYRRQLLQWGWERHKAAVEHGSRHPDATVSIQDEQAYQRLQQVIAVQAVPLVVREYAAPLPTPINEPVDTLLWKPVIVLPKDGQTQIPLVPGNAPGGYDIIVAGHTLDGRLGATRTYLPPHSFQSQPAGVSR